MHGIIRWPLIKRKVSGTSNILFGIYNCEELSDVFVLERLENKMPAVIVIHMLRTQLNISKVHVACKENFTSIFVTISVFKIWN